jgi:signal transduction histidine kinase
MIKDIIEFVRHETEILSKERHMIIKKEVSESLPTIKGNWEALQLMINNLVLNSIRFTNDFGTITIGARMSTFIQERLDDKDSLVIYIQDNGIGMPEHLKKEVFRKFYELNEIYAHKSGLVEYKSSGLGLGLSVVKRIVELHNGAIWIKSKENEGTVVFVCLPI